MRICILNVLLLIVGMSKAADHAYMSQVGQDKFLHEHFFKNKRNGVFVDIGAFDGKELSNTYFFEKDMGWKGICFEPMPEIFQRLLKNRECVCINACVAPMEGLVKFVSVKGYPEMLSGMLNTYHMTHLQRLEREVVLYGGSYEVIDVRAVTLNKILQEHALMNIDYLSIDTEGGEFEILQSIDFNKIKIATLTVENNYADSRIRRFLKSKDFTLFKVLDEFEEVYVSNSLYETYLKNGIKDASETNN